MKTLYDIKEDLKKTRSEVNDLYEADQITFQTYQDITKRLTKVMEFCYVGSSSDKLFDCDVAE